MTVENLSLKRSGFRTVQVVCSDHVTVDGVKISNNAGPSTGGVDVDSSSYVLVENCDIDNNDDDSRHQDLERPAGVHVHAELESELQLRDDTAQRREKHSASHKEAHVSKGSAR